MIGKRGDTTTLSFLIGIIVFLLIIVPIGFAVYHYWYASSKMEQTLGLLVERTNSIKDGDKGGIVGYMEEGYVLIGFEKDRNDFGGSGWWSCGGWGFPWNIEKPSKCGDRACLCACPITELPVTDTDLAVRPGACQSATCKVYDDGVDPRFYGGAECEYGPFIKTDNPVLEINYEKRGDTIGICTGKECISDDVNRAREIFESFYNAYTECKNYEVDGCICGAPSMEGMPWDHSIQFSSDGLKTAIRLVDSDGPVRSARVIDDDYFGLYYAERDESLDVAAVALRMQPDPAAGYEDYIYLESRDTNAGYYKNVNLYRSNTGKVNFAVSSEYPIEFPQDKEYCSIKAIEGTAQGDALAAADEGMGCFIGETTGGIATAAFCRQECAEDEFEIGRRGDYCEISRCCVSTMDKECIDAGGRCQDTGCAAGSQTEVTAGECPTGRPFCCKPGSLCENLAGGKCKSYCDDSLDEEEAQGSLFTSLPCDSGEVCCVKKQEGIEPLLE